MESFWATLKRAHKGTYHKISEKHLQRYVNEFSGRHNDRERDTIDQMVHMAQGMVGKRLRDLVVWSKRQQSDLEVNREPVRDSQAPLSIMALHQATLCMVQGYLSYTRIKL